MGNASLVSVRLLFLITIRRSRVALPIIWRHKPRFFAIPFFLPPNTSTYLLHNHPNHSSYRFF